MCRKVQLLEKEVPEARAVVKISEELDRDYAYLTGISFLDTIGKRHLILSCSIDGREVLAKGFEVAFLQSGDGVGPDDRFFSIRHKAAGNKINMDFQDGGISGEYPYMLKVYLRLENEVDENRTGIRAGG